MELFGFPSKEERGVDFLKFKTENVILLFINLEDKNMFALYRLLGIFISLH